MNMKKILFLLLGVMLCLTGCNTVNPENINSGNDKTEAFSIVTSFYPMYVFTKNITDGIDGVEVKNMTEVNTGCLHDYQLLPEDMKTLEKADVFVINGAGMESFMDDVIKRLPSLNVIEASENIELLLTKSHEHEHKHEHIEGELHNHDEDLEYNSHVWLSPENAVIEVKNITSKLTELDPKNAEKYKENSEKYIESLMQTDEELTNILKDFEGKNIITTHEAFDYMAKRYNFNITETVQTDHNQSISASKMAEIINKIKSENVVLIAAETQYDNTTIMSLSREGNIKIAELNAMVSGNEDYKSVYNTVMINNANALINGLGN